MKDARYIFFWAEVNPQAALVNRTFKVFWTGEEVPGGYRYVGTGLQMPCACGELAYHLYEQERGYNFSGAT
jgi:hypothetical protein